MRVPCSAFNRFRCDRLACDDQVHLSTERSRESDLGLDVRTVKTGRSVLGLPGYDDATV